MFTPKSNLTVQGLLIGFFLTTLTALGQPGESTGASNSDNKVYEAIGMMFADGSGLGKMQFTEEQIDLILAGMKKGIKLGKMPAEYQALQPNVQSIMMKKMQLARQAEQAEMSKTAEGNKVKGQEFLTLLSTQDNVKKDPSGFYYEILKKGKGPSPTMKNTVRLHYHGTLIDGTVFDSSVDRGQPTSFPMNGVIKGFSGGLTKTQVGGKIRIYIPSELGYGDNPRPGGKIKPGDTLIFECELLEIN
ncbi:MAG: FKBP-type peptidyl-prolyl cis-trans isomerase [Opitutae bacterium]|nr:FKBP-type peptidyl-prolyl cis-trans isomerase [Opitutae bacterium]MBT5717647.1 FKBP-type peptidyl-prolyl cis-trans isomerase [Opitutae bacterium]